MNARRRARTRPLIRLAALAGAVTLGTLPLTACGTGSGSGGDGGRVDVVASFYPLQFLAEEIGGTHVSVTTLTGPGGEPHDLELSPQQVGELSEADLVVYLKGLQPAVDEAVAQSGAPRVAEAGSYTTLEKHGAGEHAEEGHEGHDHGTTGGDPHVWLDPVRFAEIAEGVGTQLAKTDPEHRKAYEKNTAQLVDRLQELNEDFREGLEGRKTDTFLTTHAAFGYLAERYGLHEESVSGVDPESGAISAAHVKELHDVAREDDVSTVFFESNSSADTARTLARDLELRTGVLSPLETVRDPEKQDYLSVMHQNLSALRTALGAK